MMLGVTNARHPSARSGSSLLPAGGRLRLLPAGSGGGGLGGGAPVHVGVGGGDHGVGGAPLLGGGGLTRPLARGGLARSPAVGRAGGEGVLGGLLLLLQLLGVA